MSEQTPPRASVLERSLSNRRWHTDFQASPYRASSEGLSLSRRLCDVLAMSDVGIDACTRSARGNAAEPQ